MGNNPLEFNEGDVELGPFLEPLLTQAGGNVQELAAEPLKRAMTDGTLTTVGVKLWTALHSRAWRHREAASKALL